MIVETFKYCFHSFLCPRYIKKLGLLSDLIGIESRYSRCKQAWQPHLDNSKRVILEAAQGLKKHDSVIIFGAGSLHDVPLKELSEIFTEVHLVDIFFLQAIINEIKRYHNVDFHEIDITGVLKKTYEACSKTTIANELETLSSSIPKHFINDEFDLVISLNLLSQLPMAIKNYFEKKAPLSIEPSALSNFNTSIIKNHLSYLKSFASKGSKLLLISDTEKMVYDKNTELKACESSLEGLDESIFQGWEAIDEWTWDLAPTGELDSKYALQLKIKVFRI